MRISRGILRRRWRNGVQAKAFPIEVSRTEARRTATLYQVLQMWQLDDAVQCVNNGRMRKEHPQRVKGSEPVERCLACEAVVSRADDVSGASIGCAFGRVEVPEVAI
jgi:hypothetical protein